MRKLVKALFIPVTILAGSIETFEWWMLGLFALDAAMFFYIAQEWSHE